MIGGPPVLVLRALGIGDLATAVPALRALRAAYPDRPLVLAAPRWLAPLVRLVGGVDRLIATDDLTPRRWPLPSAHLAVNLHGRGPQSHRLLHNVCATTLFGFANPAAGHLDGPVWFAQEHEVARWCRLLRWYGIPADPADLSLTRPPPRRVPGNATVVHPGAKSTLRRWPVPRFAAVAGALVGQGHEVVVTGGPSDTALVTAVVRTAGLPPSAARVGGAGLGQLAALVAHARLVISGDTGVAHLATAYGTPSVVLFGPQSPQRWGPPPARRQHRALWHGDVAGDIRHDTAHPRLAAITVDEVLAAVATVARK